MTEIVPEPGELPEDLDSHAIGHHHQDLSGGWLRLAVFGAMDGLVTIIALVAGVGGGGAGRDAILLAGVAGSSRARSR